ncbi:hypothetical protein SH1V18_06690 [Vallitalea longa]|uniref:Uncharacterized protein n=1 Tax=Vallitalea longa TaxID=2936439 RepID=A0A9W6DF13_9FIRM|nr:hypothetical protein [Vallitalea longa]GKX28189.1 hypothetical protein SH1V18_06690 [Vallitalea longa]
MTIMHNEYVGYIHQSHSFVRGNMDKNVIEVHDGINNTVERL